MQAQVARFSIGLGGCSSTVELWVVYNRSEGMKAERQMVGSVRRRKFLREVFLYVCKFLMILMAAEVLLWSLYRIAALSILDARWKQG